MKIKYGGTRPCVSLCCSGRVTYYFGPENNFTVDITDMAHASQVLSSVQHKFEVVSDLPKPVEVKVIETKKTPKKKGKKNG